MSHVDSDLEEGEIPDDSPSSPLSKPKELPRRYILGGNKGIHQKHKKDCKYAIRRHAKRLVKLKTASVKRKISHKSHHKSYSHNKFTSKSVKHDSIGALKKYPKIINTHSLTERRSPFNDHSIFRPNSKPVGSKCEVYPFKTENAQPIKDCSFSEMLKNYKSIQSNNLNNSVSNLNQHSHNLALNSVDLPNPKNTNLKVGNMCKGNLVNKLPDAKEEIDDIEELRRIALATCAKRNLAVKQQTLTASNNMSASESTKVSLNHMPNYQKCIADNYEVVDMEVDEDNQSSVEDVDNECTFGNEDNRNSGTNDIFIIDTKPSLTLRKEPSFISKEKIVQYCSDDDFEVDLLRAELIENMCRQRSVALARSEKPQGKIHNLHASLSKPVQENSKLKCENYEIQNNRSGKIVLKHFEASKEKIATVEANKGKISPAEVNKAKIAPVEANKTKIAPVEANKAKIAPVEANKAKIAPVEANKAKIAPVEANKAKIAPVEANKAKIAPVEANKAKIAPVVEADKSPKRLIITLNGESSSEESDQEDIDPVNALPENPVASIEALISDIRQKSDSKENNDVKVVPEAVSCLSKAQQEEYNALKRILLDKKKNSEEDSEVKNKVAHSPKDDLKLLEKKLIVVTETLKKKKELMTGMAKQVTAKKQLYLKSKLTAQHLKEKYVAAEKERRIKLDVWSKSCKSFEAVKKSVSEWENKVSELQNLCSKVGSSVQRQNC